MKISITIALFVLASYQPATLLLDLTNEVRSTDEEYFAVPEQDRANEIGAVGAASHGQLPPTAPFEIIDMQFDKTSYLLGESFHCELTLRHTGPTTVAFPIETRMHLFRRSMPTLQVAAAQMTVDPLSSQSTGWRIQFHEQFYGGRHCKREPRAVSPKRNCRNSHDGPMAFLRECGRVDLAGGNTS